MQSSTSRHALSRLASKLHPQVPLTARESQQLLNLLTTSFRNHLDREHPVPAPEKSQAQRSPQALVKDTQDNALLIRFSSSYSSAHHHLESILTNPLFAVKPRRRGSNSAFDVLKDPVIWFRDQVAIGAADISKANMCLHLLHTLTLPGGLYNLHDKRKPGTMIAEWLRTSGLDTSAGFVKPPLPASHQFYSDLIDLLVAEGMETAVWRWFTHHPEQRIRETGLDASHILTFRQLLLRKLVTTQSRHSPEEALASFLRAFRMMRAGEYGVTPKLLRPAGAHLVKIITANNSKSDLVITPDAYDSFLYSTRDWLDIWCRPIQAALWVHHPTKPTAIPGLDFIRDSKGASTLLSSRQAKQHFLIHLCLDVARQLVADGKYTAAQIPMNFLKDHFAHIVLPDKGPLHRETRSHEKERLEQLEREQQDLEQQENLKLLDQLMPT